MSGFIDFANVKARCSVEQAAKLLDLKTTEERSNSGHPARSTAEPPGRSSSPRQEPFSLLSVKDGRRSNRPGQPRQRHESKKARRL
jgi:hypothetical protein